jgi:hypothetical protein
VINTTTHKIQRGVYYWHTIFSYVHEISSSFYIFHLFIEKKNIASLPLELVIVDVSLQQSGLDFIGEFKDNYNNFYIWILIATSFFTRWVEAIPTQTVVDKVVMDLLEERMTTHFGVPTEVTTDNEKYFSFI